jgi:hypothetical protein
MKFDARVLGVPDHLANARKHLSRADFALEAAKLKAAESELMECLPALRRSIHGLFRRRHECVSHFRCDRFNFLLPLQQFAAFVDDTTPEDVIEQGATTTSGHVILLGQSDCLIVPVDFEHPVEVAVEGRPFVYMVCSAMRIKHELDLLDEYFAVERTMGLRQFDAFVHISGAAMERFEKQEGVGRRFWAKWGVLALRGIVERSIAAGVPAFIDPNFAAVPAKVQ